LLSYFINGLKFKIKVGNHSQQSSAACPMVVWKEWQRVAQWWDTRHSAVDVHTIKVMSCRTMSLITLSLVIL